VSISPVFSYASSDERSPDYLSFPPCFFRYQELNDELARLGHKLFLPLDPGPGATIGGMISTGCSGESKERNVHMSVAFELTTLHRFLSLTGTNTVRYG